MFFIDEYLQKVKTIRDSIALTDRDGKRSYTYGQLDSLTNQIANRLISRGVRAGDSVIILLPARDTGEDLGARVLINSLTKILGRERITVRYADDLTREKELDDSFGQRRQVV